MGQGFSVEFSFADRLQGSYLIPKMSKRIALPVPRDAKKKIIINK